MRKYLFSDESGDFAFSRKSRASRYFIICTVVMDSCDVGAALLDLHRQLAWEGVEVGNQFHASEDKQAVRDRVYDLICRYPFSIQATVMEKSKAQPQVRLSNERFYQYGWYYNAKHGVARAVRQANELLVTTASVGTKKGQKAFSDGVNDVCQQILGNGGRWKTFFCSSESDPCLQLTDYCTWAIQKKWETGDTRSYELIRGRITHEYDLWGHGKTHYY